MWLSCLIAFMFLVLPLASSISLFSSEKTQRRETNRSTHPEVDYGHALLMALLVTVAVGAVLYAVLFTTFAPVHDAAHQLRHGMAVIPCH